MDLFIYYYYYYYTMYYLFFNYKASFSIFFREQPQQPLYSTVAHVFQIDPDTKKSWLPVSKQAASVSFYYDSNKFIYKILSVENSKVNIDIFFPYFFCIVSSHFFFHRIKLLTETKTFSCQINGDLLLFSRQIVSPSILSSKN